MKTRARAATWTCGWGLRSERWSIVAFGDNVSDERNYSNYAYSGSQGNYLPGRPRTYGVEFEVRL